MTQMAAVQSRLSERFSGAVGSAADQIFQRISQAVSALETRGSSAIPKPEDDKSLECQLFDARAACKIATSQIAMHFDDAWRRGLFRQLDSLIDFESWEDSDLPPNTESFRTLIRMVLFLGPHRRPGLAVTHTGNFIATWSEGDSHLTLECKPSDQFRWFVAHAGENAGGNSSLSRLKAVLGPYNPETWFEKASAKANT